MSDVAAAQAEIERWLVRYQQAPDSKAFAPLADAYRAAGRPQDAVRVLEAGLGRHPEYVSGLVLLGLCWRELHEDERAETTFARVLELDPENLVALRHRAECARRRGVLDRAAEYLRRALAIDPFDRDVQADLGLVTTALERQARDRPESTGPMQGIGPRVVAVAPSVTPAVPYPAPAAGDPFARPAAVSRATEPSRPTSEVAPSRPLPPAPPPAPASAPPFPAPAAPAAASVEPPAPSPRAEMWGRAAVEPPSIDLRRVGRSEPAGSPGPAREPLHSETPPLEPAPEQLPTWRYTREADRIVVAPTDTPVRGPIRSVEDRLFGEQRPVRQANADVPDPATAAGESPPAPGAPTGEFATMTLGRIYESQGYLQKAAAIYEKLQQQRPDDPEVAQRLAAVRRRQAGAPEAPPSPSATFAPAIRLAAPPPAPPAPAPPWAVPAPRAVGPPTNPPGAVPSSPAPRAGDEGGVAWRLLDPAQLGDPVDTAGKLRRVTETVRDQEQQRRHTVIGGPSPAAPPAPHAAAAPPPEDLSRGHEDYQRFLSYLRSLRP